MRQVKIGAVALLCLLALALVGCGKASAGSLNAGDSSTAMRSGTQASLSETPAPVELPTNIQRVQITLAQTDSRPQTSTRTVTDPTAIREFSGIVATLPRYSDSAFTFQGCPQLMNPKRSKATVEFEGADGSWSFIESTPTCPAYPVYEADNPALHFPLDDSRGVLWRAILNALGINEATWCGPQAQRSESHFCPWLTPTATPTSG